MPLIQLLSSKHPAYCPSCERKKNATEMTQRRTADKTSVENTAKTKTACRIRKCGCAEATGHAVISVSLLGERRQELTMTDALSLPSSGSKRGMVPVSRGVLIINCGRSKIRESKGWSTGRLFRTDRKELWGQPCSLGRRKKKK